MLDHVSFCGQRADLFAYWHPGPCAGPEIVQWFGLLHLECDPHCDWGRLTFSPCPGPGPACAVLDAAAALGDPRGASGPGSPTPASDLEPDYFLEWVTRSSLPGTGPGTARRASCAFGSGHLDLCGGLIYPASSVPEPPLGAASSLGEEIRPGSAPWHNR